MWWCFKTACMYVCRATHACHCPCAQLTMRVCVGVWALAQGTAGDLRVFTGMLKLLFPKAVTCVSCTVCGCRCTTAEL